MMQDISKSLVQMT